jgi:pSer/pThr/pTyr-binding forkhead associated (FHA) protein
MRQSNEAYEPSVLRYTTLERRQSDPSGLWLSIGRTSDNDIVVNDYAVSRQHARFRRVAGAGFVIEDLGSVNGTALDGQWLEPKVQNGLRSGQALRFGRLGFTFLEPTDFHTFLVTLVPLT